MRVIRVDELDAVNGLGIGVTVWISGCRHKCLGCFNTTAWNYDYGLPLEEVKGRVLSAVSKGHITRLSLLGGDPICQPDIGLELLINFLKEIKEKSPKLKIWLWSGYTLEEIQRSKSKKKDVISLVDYFVDGRFVEELANPNLAFRGSSNQVIYKRTDKGLEVDEVLMSKKV